MDKMIYFVAESTCKAMQSIGMDQLAYDIGFKGVISFGLSNEGIPAVFCGPQPSSYHVGVIVLLITIIGLTGAASIVRKKMKPGTSAS